MGIAAAVAASALILSSPSEPLPLPLPRPTVPESEGRPVEVLATGLDEPRGIATVEDGRIFVAEKDGRILVIQNSTLLERPLATLRTADVFAGGLLGITTHPDFVENHLLYVYFTYEEDGSFWNKIMRITESESRLVSAKTILDDIPGSAFSNGGALEFGPDGKLYAGTGSVSDSLHLSQDMESLAGKILRVNDDGTIPDDNPFPDSPVYSMGWRDPQGITWNSEGVMMAVDLGPTKNDEINLVEPASNFGWPDQECRNNPSFADSAMCYDPAIEPGGIVYYTGDRLPLEDKIVLTSLRSVSLFQLDIEEGLPSQKSLLSGLGRLRDVHQDNDGNLYVTTSNTDGKGFPGPDDDILVKIVR